MRWFVCLTIAATLAGCDPELDRQTRRYDPRHEVAELDVIAPRGATGAPAVMYVHGGAWSRGERGNDAGTVERLARAGYVAVNVDYRLVPDGTFPAAVHDVACALAYVQAEADTLGVDRTRIAVMGHSAGAHLISLVAVAAELEALQDPGCPSGRAAPPAAAVSVAGPMDLRTLGGDPTAAFVGVSLADDPATWALASPIAQVASGEPPFLFIHAEADRVVPVAQSEQMLAALRARDNAASYLRLEGGGHVIGDGAGLGQLQFELSTDTPEAWMALLDFLDRTLGRTLGAP